MLYIELSPDRLVRSVAVIERRGESPERGPRR
jgi:hypothetical protein